MKQQNTSPPGFDGRRYVATTSNAPPPPGPQSPPPAAETRAPESSRESRWSDEETSALLSIRIEMDHLFQKENAVKSTLWEEVARRLAAKGFHRTGNKCSRKFSNCCNYNNTRKKENNEKSKPQSSAEGGGGNKKPKSYKFSKILEAIQVQDDGQRENLRIVEQNASSIQSMGPVSSDLGAGKKRSLKDLCESFMQYVIEKQDEAKTLRIFLENVEKLSAETYQNLDTTDRQLQSINKQISASDAKVEGVMSMMENIQQKDTAAPPPPPPLPVQSPSISMPPPAARVPVMGSEPAQLEELCWRKGKAVMRDIDLEVVVIDSDDDDDDDEA